MRTVATLIMAGALVAGCAKGASPVAPRATAPPPVTTAPPGPSCHEVCERTFGTCAREVLEHTAQVPADLMAQFTRSGMLAFYKQAGYKRCVDLCTRASAPIPPGALIRMCLTHGSCEAYAVCIKPRGGISGATSGASGAPR